MKRNLLVSIFFLLAAAAQADGINVDKVYYPTVNPLETEIEYRSTYRQDDNNHWHQQHKFGIGQSINERWAAEIYALGKRAPHDSIELEGYEAEARWQLTEQGEYAVDWGMVFELEREFERNAWEAGATLIVQRQWQDWVGTANLTAAHEWGSGIKDEMDYSVSGQFKYRYRRWLEPAIEVYSAEGGDAAGIVWLGSAHTGARKKLRWDTGLFRGFSGDTRDWILKLNLEFEF